MSQILPELASLSYINSAWTFHWGAGNGKIQAVGPWRAGPDDDSRVSISQKH